MGAAELTVGATVRDAAGAVGVVETLVVVDAPQVMHILTIARVATYAVGSAQWVVHNNDLPSGCTIVGDFDTKPYLLHLQKQNPEAFENILGRANGVVDPRRRSRTLYLPDLEDVSSAIQHFAT